jgi:hypothetical protein
MIFPWCFEGASKKKPPGQLAVFRNIGVRLPDLLRQRLGKGIKAEPELVTQIVHVSLCLYS